MTDAVVVGGGPNGLAAAIVLGVSGGAPVALGCALADPPLPAVAGPVPHELTRATQPRIKFALGQYRLPARASNLTVTQAAVDHRRVVGQ